MTDTSPDAVRLYAGADIAAYGFGDGHPFGPDRHDAFMHALRAAGLDSQVVLHAPATASRAALELFHTPAYVDHVIRRCEEGTGYLDAGDTPAMPGLFEATCAVVGTTVAAADALMAGECRRAFVPIAGLHHAARDTAAGFCVFNDCGVAAEHLRREHGLRRVAYVDIDAHHGDGVYYGFDDDPLVIFADIHEDGRFLYPGTGSPDETGRGAAEGTKLNIPLLPGADDAAFFPAWEEVEAFLEAARPELILFQCGADSLAGDPITHMQLSERAHAHAARRLCEIADRHAGGRLLGMGGGGYNRDNIARAWTAVVQSFVEATHAD